ncbi:MAG: hypothetical protein WCI61_01855 [Chloroflexota bacterium]
MSGGNSERIYWQKRIGRRGMLRAGALGGAGIVGAALIGCGSNAAGDAKPDREEDDGKQPYAS